MKSSFIRENTSWPVIVLTLALVVALSALSAWVVCHTLQRDRPTEPRDLASFYAQIGLTPDEQAQIAVMDAGFESGRIALMRDFEKARKQLADHLTQQDSHSPETDALILKVHHLHGELQALSIRRYFAILESLPAPQRSQLRKLAADTLSRPQ